MNNIKVVKFGGSSLADAGQFRKAADIVLADQADVLLSLPPRESVLKRI